MQYSYKQAAVVVFLLFMQFIMPGKTFAQGTWTAVTDTAPGLNNGVMLLLTDGSVITITVNDPNAVWDDSANATWNKLTPDSTGSYVNGKWSVIAPMAHSRIYFSSQVLQNGKVYIAGGEFGTGSGLAELYDPLTDTWSNIPGVPNGYYLGDCNSDMLPDGRVLQNVVDDGTHSSGTNLIYDPVSDSIIPGPHCGYSDDEAAWLKLPDYSILFEATNSTLTSRYIPALNNWINDGQLPVTMYDNYGSEAGAGLMLPDGRGFFLGSSGYTVYYTPSGDTSEGHFTQGPTIPGGYGTPDAPAAMMNDGHILCAVARIPDGPAVGQIFSDTSYFYDFDYTTNTFHPLPAPGGGDSVNQPSCSSVLLCLPDGNVLLGIEGSNRYYIYTPGNPPLAAGKPTVDSVIPTGCGYMITGTLFNGITQGAAYGDDWQMATNYPVVRLVAQGKTYYARTTNWNRTGIQTGNLPDTAYFTMPASVPNGDYALLLSANGNSSDTFNFRYINCLTGIAQAGNSLQQLKAVPNPARQQTTLLFSSTVSATYIIRLNDIFGKTVLTEQGAAVAGDNTHHLKLAGLAAGVYFASITMEGQEVVTKVVVQ